MRTVNADGPSFSAFDLIVPAFFVLALILNTALPYMGFAEPSATCTLVLATLSLIALIRARPVFSVSMLYILVIGLTAFVAGVGVEAGGLLAETGVQGTANGSFSRLFPFYIVFVGCALFTFNRIIDEKRSHSFVSARMTVEPWSLGLGFVLALAVIGAGVLAGLTGGFAFLNGVNRYALRNDASSGGPLFNLFLNNQTFVAILLGTFVTSSSRAVRWFSVLLLLADIALDALHGEQFMSVLNVTLTALIPIIAINALRGKPVVRYMGIGAGIALLLGGVSVFFAYKGQGLDVSDTIFTRFLLQGQVWYVVDHDAGLLSAPALGGIQAFGRFVGSLASWTAPTFFYGNTPTGLRELMASYATPAVLRAYMFDDVTFTMGQMAIPVYWFGLLGGAVFVAFAGLVYGALAGLQIVLAMRGGVVMLWLITKIFSYATFAIQQGEYWTLFGSRTIFYMIVAAIWWYFVDARGATGLSRQRPS